MNEKQPNTPVRISAVFQRKEAALEPQVCEIEKVVTLPGSEFAVFQQQLLADYAFIADNAERMGIRDGVAHCLLVVDETSGDGILVNSEGSGYARYSAYFPGAKYYLQTQEQAEALLTETAAPSALSIYSGKMRELLEDCVYKALDGHDEAVYVFSLEELRASFDAGSFNEKLFTAMLAERPEVLDLDTSSSGEVRVTLSPESIQAHALSKLRVLSQDDLIIMQAKHTLWLYDEGGAQADFSGCWLSGLDMRHMQLNGAVGECGYVLRGRLLLRL